MAARNKVKTSTFTELFLISKKTYNLLKNLKNKQKQKQTVSTPDSYYHYLTKTQPTSFIYQTHNHSHQNFRSPHHSPSSSSAEASAAASSSSSPTLSEAPPSVRSNVTSMNTVNSNIDRWVNAQEFEGNNSFETDDVFDIGDVVVDNNNNNNNINNGGNNDSDNNAGDDNINIDVSNTADVVTPQANINIDQPVNSNSIPFVGNTQDTNHADGIRPNQVVINFTSPSSSSPRNIDFINQSKRANFLKRKRERAMDSDLINSQIRSQVSSKQVETREKLLQKKRDEVKTNDNPVITITSIPANTSITSSNPTPPITSNVGTPPTTEAAKSRKRNSTQSSSVIPPIPSGDKDLKTKSQKPRKTYTKSSPESFPHVKIKKANKVFIADTEEKVKSPNSEFVDRILQSDANNPYDVFQFSKTARITYAGLKRKFNAFSKKLHPDKEPSPGAHEAFIIMRRSFIQLKKEIQIRDELEKEKINTQRKQTTTQKGYGINKWRGLCK
jgi:hypothetical protein